MELGGAGAKIKGRIPKGIKNITDEYLHPESAYLNDFEKAFEDWVKRTLGANDRLVIFIDDLDRCMPEIALQVLEALKLYLNIKKVIFLVGADDDVINSLVKKHYLELGVGEHKAREYLAKFFQVDVRLAHTDAQMGDFLVRDLVDVGVLKEFPEGAGELVSKVVDAIAYPNPSADGTRRKATPHELRRKFNTFLVSPVGDQISAMIREASVDR